MLKYLAINLLFIGAIIFTFSCKTKKQVSNPPEKMAFYTIVVTRDTVKKESSFAVRSVQVADTKLSRKPDDQSKNANFLQIQIIDKNKNVISIATEHPLFKRFDLYTESGEIESKSISLQQGEVTFRVPYFSDYKKITIVETINFKQSKPITIDNEK